MMTSFEPFRDESPSYSSVKKWAAKFRKEMIMNCLGALKRLLPVPQISEGFRATSNNYEENIVWSIGTFTTKQFFTEK